MRAIQEGQQHLLAEEPSGFASRKVARDHCEAQLASVREAIPLLESQLEETRRHAQSCAEAIELACEQVVIAEAEERAASFVRKVKEVREESYLLRFLAARQVKRPPSEIKNNPMVAYGSLPTRAIKMSKEVLAACQDDVLGLSEYHGGIRVRDATAQAVADYWTRLHNDADAQLAKVETPPPFDSAAYAEQCKRAIAEMPPEPLEEEAEEEDESADAACK